jgi:two-component sensor histidine kinase
MKHLIIISTLILILYPQAAGQELPYRNFNTHNGLPQIQVRHLYQDVSGYIWIGTKGGVAQYNGEHFHHFLINDHIYDIKGDQNGTIYITATSGFYIYDGEVMQLCGNYKGRVRIIPGNDECILYGSDWVHHYKHKSLYKTYDKNKLHPVNLIGGIAFDFDKEELFFADAIGSAIYACKNDSLRIAYMPADGCAALPGQFPNSTLCYTEVQGNTHRLFNLLTGTYFFSYTTNQHNQVDEISIRHLPMRNYLFYHNYSFYNLDSATSTFEEISLPFIKAAYPVIIDRDNNLWAGSDNGLYQIWTKPFKQFPREFMNDFWTIIKGRDNIFYGGAFKQGLYRLNLEKKEKKEILVPGPYQQKETDYYYGASKDAVGNLYFPTHYGLVKYNYRQSQKFDTGISLITKFDPVTNSIVFGQQNGLGWIDANNDIRRSTDSLRTNVKSHPSSLEFMGDSVIWIGTGQSLCYYHRKRNTFIDLKSKYPKAPHQGVIAMHADATGNIWMGSRNGLWLFSSQENAFQNIAISDVSNYITSLISTRNLLIIGTTRELIVMDLKSYYYDGTIKTKLFNFRNGMLGQEVAQNSFALNGDQLMIPTTTYTLQLDLNAISFDNELFEVAITHVNEQAVNHRFRNSVKPYQIPKHLNDIDITYEMVGFGLPTTPLYRYKLVGYNDEWSQWTKHNRVTYSNLSSGRYIFMVATKAGGQTPAVKEKISELHLIVSLPFYKEPYFYKVAFFVLLLSGLTIGYITWSRYRLKLAAINHQKKVQYLEVATLQANLNPHFIFNMLSSVQNLINQHKPNVANEYLIKFSRLIRAYMESSIKSSKVHQSSSSNEISIKDEIELISMYIEFEQIKYRDKKFEYQINVTNRTLLNRTIPPMILQPLVENAIKHGLHQSSELGYLSILFEEDGDLVVCTICDNGIGRAESKKRQENSIKAYESRGIELINRRIEVLQQLGYNINIEYQDPPTGGTIVKIYFGA